MKSGRDVDKFEEMHLTPLESKVISAPGIAESPVNIECRLVEIKELGSHHMFLAEVVGVTVDDQYINETGKFELNATGLVSYSHGEYFTLGENVGKFGYSVRKSAKGGKKATKAKQPTKGGQKPSQAKAKRPTEDGTRPNKAKKSGEGSKKAVGGNRRPKKRK